MPDAQPALLGKLVKLPHERADRLLILVAKLTPDLVVAAVVLLELLVRSQALQFRREGSNQIVDLVVDNR